MLSALARRHVSAYGRPVADEHGIEIEPDLAQILPPDAADDDLPFLPGWDEPL